MARPRIELQRLFEDILGTRNVYHQPPNNHKMAYPCIVYKRDRSSVQYADNVPYRRTKRYMVTVIDRDPDSVFAEKIAELPLCADNRFYTADNLNHFVYNLYF